MATNPPLPSSPQPTTGKMIPSKHTFHINTSEALPHQAALTLTPPAYSSSHKMAALHANLLAKTPQQIKNTSYALQTPKAQKEYKTVCLPTNSNTSTTVCHLMASNSNPHRSHGSMKTSSNSFCAKAKNAKSGACANKSGSKSLPSNVYALVVFA